MNVDENHIMFKELKRKFDAINDYSINTSCCPLTAKQFLDIYESTYESEGGKVWRHEIQDENTTAFIKYVTILMDNEIKSAKEQEISTVTISKQLQYPFINIHSKEFIDFKLSIRRNFKYITTALKTTPFFVLNSYIPHCICILNIAWNDEFGISITNEHSFK